MSSVNDEFVVVSTTIDDEEKAGELARRLIEARLAACVHRVPIQSTYWWKGEVESANEIALSAKTRASLTDEVIAFIKENHSYEVPEIIVTPVVAGHPDYLAWIEEETRR